MSVESSKARSRYQDDLSDLQAEYARKKKKLTEQNEQEIGDLQESHQNRKQALNSQNEAAINHIQKTQADSIEKYTESREKSSKKGQEKIEKMQTAYDAKIQEMQQERADSINKINSEKKKKLQEISDFTQNKISQAREEGKREIDSIKNYYKSAGRSENEKSAVKLGEAREQNEVQVNSEKMRGERSQEKVRAAYEQQIKKLHQDGDAQAQFEKNLADEKLLKVDNDFKKKYDKTLQTWNQREKYMQDSYAQKLERQKSGHQALLKSQTQHFEKSYDKREHDNEVALEIQEGRYTKQLLNEKRKFTREASKYAGKEEDPFYKIEDRGSKFWETPNAYIVKAFSPDHEKDQIRVTVDRSKAVVSGQRAFKDKIEDDNKKVSTENYQSFREEFKFDIPVATEAMVRERRGDFVIFEIPKMSAVDSSTLKFSKKV
jgi:HSP20 family molecular chaperone IbpA